MRFRLRTLMIALAILPPLIAAAWFYAGPREWIFIIFAAGALLAFTIRLQFAKS
jgi:hypothetical protein